MSEPTIPPEPIFITVANGRIPKTVTSRLESAGEAIGRPIVVIEAVSSGLAMQGPHPVDINVYGVHDSRRYDRIDDLGLHVATAILGSRPGSLPEWEARIDAMIEDGSIGDKVAHARISHLQAKVDALTEMVSDLGAVAVPAIDLDSETVAAMTLHDAAREIVFPEPDPEWDDPTLIDPLSPTSPSPRRGLSYLSRTTHDD
jgi:hypothetical protein